MRVSQLPSGACALTLLAGVLLASDAHAAPPKPKARPKVSVEEIAVMLSSTQEDELRTALETAATLHAADVMPLLEDRVRAGLSRDLLQVALDSLQLLDDKSATSLLSDLALHRRPEVRARVLEVIGSLKAVHLESVLVRGLHDLDANVQKAAASALAESGARASVPVLEKALERGIEPAGAALGKLAKPDELGHLLDYVGRLPLASVTPMLSALLSRRDLGEADKLRAVTKVTTLPGDDAVNGSEALLQELPSDASPRVKRALSEAIEKGNAQ